MILRAISIERSIRNYFYQRIKLAKISRSSEKVFITRNKFPGFPSLASLRVF